MDWLQGAPVWLIALLIFSLRILDVSLGTVRMLTVVAGRVRISVVLGFIEVLTWIFAINQVLSAAGKNPWLMLAYAGGFATGNAVGIWVERRIAMGKRVLRIISLQQGEAIARRMREDGHIVTTFTGEGRDGPRTLLYLLTERKEIDALIRKARELDPTLFYVVEPVADSSRMLSQPVVAGPRTILKKK